MYLHDSPSPGSEDQAVHHRHIASFDEHQIRCHGLYWSSSTSMAGSLDDLSTPSPSSSSSVISVASSLISNRWTGSRFQLAAEYLKGERVSWSAFMSAIINFTNSIVGAGLMGIPYALSRAGLLPGILLLIIVAAISGTVYNGRDITSHSF